MREFLHRIAAKIPDIAREIPLLGGLVDCNLRDHWKAIQQTFITIVFSTLPIWLGALIILSGGEDISFVKYLEVIKSSINRGELFTYCVTLLAPIFWLALTDAPGGRNFPNKLAHIVLITLINAVCAVFFSRFASGQKVNLTLSYGLSVSLFFASNVLLYLGTLYHTNIIKDGPAEFKRQEENFVESYQEHRNEPD